ncbi:hypothetical protein [Streptomyces griseoluteus]
MPALRPWAAAVSISFHKAVSTVTDLVGRPRQRARRRRELNDHAYDGVRTQEST